MPRQSSLNLVKRRSLGKKIWDYRWIYVMLLPATIFFIIFRYVPIYGIQLAFKDYRLAGIAASEWNDFAHFHRMFSDSGSIQAVRNTLIISFMRIIVGFPIPIILALMINEVRMRRYKRVLQTIYTFPHFLSWVLLAGIMLNLLGSQGMARKIVEMFSPAMASEWNLLYSGDAYRWILVISDMWKEAGWGTIIYLAAIAGIDASLYEAADIDGCNRLQRIWHVIIPGMIGIIAIQFVLRVGFIMEGGFEQVFNTYSPPVYAKGDIIDTYIYRQTFERGADFGFTTAVGLFKNMINLILLLTANTVTRMLGQRTLW